MGAYLSEPVTDKISEDETTDRLKFGASSMQGWRVSQEDAHNCIPNYDENTSLFAVYDGHGGAEVAEYCSMHLPNFIKSSNMYKAGNIAQALEDAFLDFDVNLVKEDVLQNLKQMAGVTNDTEDSENEVNFLYEEAHMPLEELLARYHKSSIENQQLRNNAKNDNKSQSPFLRGKAQSKLVESSAGPSCSFASSDEKTYTKENSSKQETEEDSRNHKPVEDVPKISDPLARGDSSKDSELNGNAEPVEKNKLDVSVSSAMKGSKDKPATEINGDMKNDLNDSIVSDISSTPTPEKGKGKGKGKGKNILGLAVTEPGSKKDGEMKTPKRQPTRIGHHRQAKPINMEDNSGDSHDSESDDEYKCAMEVTVAEEEDDENDGEMTVENDNSMVDDESDEESDEDDDDEDDEDEDENDADDEDDGFAVVDKEEAGYDSGCTAVVALLRGDELYVANAGDSRCIVCRAGKAIEMSHDHKPEDELEMKRIVAAGGKVTADGRVNGGLNLSRAIGDHSYKKNENLPLRDQMISALPDIRTLTVDTEEDEFMVIACDGIWNFMNSQQVVDFVRERLTPDSDKLSSICEELFDKCLAPTTVGDGTGCDNMTCIIVKFHHNKEDATRECKRNMDSATTVDNLHKRPRTDFTEKMESSIQSQ